MAYTAVDTWDLPGDTVSNAVRVDRDMLSTPWEGSFVQRRQRRSSEADGQAARRTWIVRYANATKADYNRAMTLWQKTLGGALGLNYSTAVLSYAGTDAVIVRMVAKPFLIQQLADNRYSFEVKLEEVHNAP